MMENSDEVKLLNDRLDSLQKELYSIRSEVFKLRETKKNETSFSGSTKPEPQKIKPTPKPKSEKTRDLESYLGGNILGKAGFFAVILASTYFIKYAVQNRWINESVRIGLGMITGFVFCVTGLYYAKRKLKILPEVFFGTGGTLLFLAVYGAFYYDFISPTETFIALAFLSVSLSILASATGFQILYIFSILFYILNPFLVSQGDNSYRILFAYLGFSNALYVFLTRKQDWQIAPYFILASNIFIFTGWASKYLEVSSRWYILAYLYISYLLLYWKETIPSVSVPERVHRSTLFLQGFIPIYFLISSYYVLYNWIPSGRDHFLLIFAGSLVLFQKHSTSFFSHRPSKVANILQSNLLRIAITAYSIIFAVSDFGEGRWVQFSWTITAFSLALAGTLYSSKSLLYLSYPAWLVALYILATQDSGSIPGSLAILNFRMVEYIFTATCFFTVWHFHKGDFTKKQISFFPFISLAVLILGTLLEARHLIKDTFYRNFAFTGILSAYALVLIGGGAVKSHKKLRIAGIVLAVVVALKFFLLDIWSLSLGIRIGAGLIVGGSLIMISIYYQRKKDKMKNLILIVALTGLTLPFSYSEATPFRKEGFHYFKDLKPATATSEKQGKYGLVELDADVIRHSGSIDRKVIWNDKVLPSFTRTASSQANTGSRKPEIIFDEYAEGARVYVLKLPNPPEGTEYSDLQIESDSKYETQIAFSTAKSPGKWLDTEYVNIYKYSQSGDEKSMISFNRPGSRFLRLSFDSEKTFRFPRVNYRPIDMKKENLLSLSTKDYTISQDSTIGETVILFPNPTKQPIHKLTIFAEPAAFSRKATLYYKNEHKEYIYKSNLQLENKNEKAESSHTFFISPPESTTLRIIIKNGNDAPITIKNLNAFTPVQELIFLLPTRNHSEKGPIRLYYGNQYDRNQDYDIKSTYESKAVHANFNAGNEIKNPDFGYSMIEPPLSIWILRVLFLAGILALAFPSWSILRKYAKDSGSPLESQGPVSEGTDKSAI